jgi:simple sugar transport system permease protein
MTPVSDPSFIVLVAGFLAAALRVAVPLLIAALGETVSERGGVINLGLEGAMLTGALAAALGASSAGPWTGLACGAAAGLALMAIFATITVWAGADQIIAGTAVTLGAVGLTGAVYREVYGSEGVGLTLPLFVPSPIPVLSRIPVLGPALFTQPVVVYLALALVPLFWWLLFRSRWGLALRASGESASSAAAAGIHVRWMKTGGVLAGGLMGGLAGATLVLAQVGTFAERMTAGRGFVAIAIVVLGRWHPAGVAVASLVFGMITALQFLFQALGLGVPYQVFLMLPYLLTLVGLAVLSRRRRLPVFSLAR